MNPIKLGKIELEVMGVTVTVCGAVYYPPEPETRIDPAEPAFVEWGSVMAGDQDISELFEYKFNADRLEEAILNNEYVEEAKYGSR